MKSLICQVWWETGRSLVFLLPYEAQGWGGDDVSAASQCNSRKPPNTSDVQLLAVASICSSCGIFPLFGINSARCHDPTHPVICTAFVPLTEHQRQKWCVKDAHSKRRSLSFNFIFLPFLLFNVWSQVTVLFFRPLDKIYFSQNLVPCFHRKSQIEENAMHQLAAILVCWAAV